MLPAGDQDVVELQFHLILVIIYCTLLPHTTKQLAHTFYLLLLSAAGACQLRDKIPFTQNTNLQTRRFFCITA